MFRFILDNNLLTTIYSDFKPGHSCINRLLSIPHEIYKLFDNRLEVRSVVVFWLEQNSISGDLLNILRIF